MELIKVQIFDYPFNLIITMKIQTYYFAVPSPIFISTPSVSKVFLLKIKLFFLWKIMKHSSN